MLWKNFQIEPAPALPGAGAGHARGRRGGSRRKYRVQIVAFLRQPFGFFCIMFSIQWKLADTNGELELSISGIRTAKAFADEETGRNKFDGANNRCRTAKSGYYRAMAFYPAGMEFFMGLLAVLVIAVGGFTMI